ncbi:autotransporter outer membrane beta-barrel domain-containing protein [Candidatus Methylopumilus universalis]|uniref:autotransporter outer membrane beta-barrel domain-containing protein n=1 Tax=Candidatus Methylopumilus universalis TaxID=2588536 RepID=UPI003BEF4002
MRFNNHNYLTKTLSNSSKKNLKKLGLTALISLMSLNHAFARTSLTDLRVLYFEDYHVGTDAIQLSLTSNGITHLKTSSYSAFDTAIATGSYNFVIYNNQNVGVDAGNMTSLSTYLAAGGKALGTTWTTAGAGTTMMSMFGVTPTGRTNGTDVSGISSFPISISNPGWGVYDKGVITTDATLYDSIGETSAGTFLVRKKDRKTFYVSVLNDSWTTPSEASLFYYTILTDGLFTGPTVSDTQQSLARLASGLRNIYNHASLISNFPNSNTYDCNLFDVKGMCISAGGRYSTVDNPSSNNSAAVVTLGYKVSPNIRIGGFLDQSVNTHSPTGIDISNKHPMMGAFAYWNQNADGLGYQVKIANAYQDKDLSTIRDVIGTSEAGRGNTSLNTRSYVSELSYAFMYKENTLVRPYFALRHTTIEQDAYTETGVEAPLTYSALNDRTTSALMGVKFKHALTPKTNLIGSLGVEQDLHHKTDRLTATNADLSTLTSENFSGNLHHTRPVASLGATYDIAKAQRLSGEVLVQQLPFQSTAGATAYFNYMIGF